MPPEEFYRLLEDGFGGILLFGGAGMLGLLGIHLARIRWLSLVPGARPEPPLWGAAEVLLALAVWFLAEIFFAASAPVLEPLLGGERGALLGVTLGARLLGCAWILVLVRWYGGQPVSALGLVPTAWQNLLLIPLVFILVLMAMNGVAFLWNCLLYFGAGLEPELQTAVEHLEESIKRRERPIVVLYVGMAVVVAPFAEELLFRGLLFGWLRRPLGRIAAALVSAVIFAVVHFSVSAFFPLLFLGLILAWLYERTDSLCVPFLFHCVFNATTVLLLSLR